tara:strand:- start:58 stop:645 length:588 start_codon:yes stop_codon:yes gene_type:complete
MTKKKKKKIKSLKKKPIFVKFRIPGDKEEILIEARHLQRGLDVLYANAPAHSKAAKAITMKLQEVLRYNKMNWLGFILFAETLRVTPSVALTLLGKHFSGEKMRKLRVGFLNSILVKSLLKKIDGWGGVPKAWSNHRAYINSWCRKTKTPLFNSLSNFQDHITAWKNATVGKRKWEKIGGYSAKGDKEFSIFNPP